MKPISYTRAAIKALQRMPANISAPIDWRVIREDGVVLAVLEIGPRGGVYE